MSITSTEHRGQPKHNRSHVALIAQLGEHCTSNAKVMGLNPIQSQKTFSGHFPSSVMAAFASIIISTILRNIHEFSQNSSSFDQELSLDAKIVYFGKL